MTLRLRPHHLLCMLTYVGKGYSSAFTASFDAIAHRICEGEAILVVDGPDDVCAALLPDAEAHCHHAGIRQRDQQAASDLNRLQAGPVHTGASLRLDKALLARMQAGFASGKSRSACGGCQWAPLCDRVAAEGFKDTRLGRLHQLPAVGTHKSA